MLEMKEGLLPTFRITGKVRWSLFNPLSPKSDENEISLYMITPCSNIQVMRMKKVINKGKMSWYLDKINAPY